jgi:hypothetical protein
MAGVIVMQYVNVLIYVIIVKEEKNKIMSINLKVKILFKRKKYFFKNGDVKRFIKNFY